MFSSKKIAAESQALLREVKKHGDLYDVNILINWLQKLDVSTLTDAEKTRIRDAIRNDSSDAHNLISLCLTLNKNQIYLTQELINKLAIDYANLLSHLVDTISRLAQYQLDTLTNIRTLFCHIAHIDKIQFSLWTHDFLVETQRPLTQPLFDKIIKDNVPENEIAKHNPILILLQAAHPRLGAGKSTLSNISQLFRSPIFDREVMRIPQVLAAPSKLF